MTRLDDEYDAENRHGLATLGIALIKAGVVASALLALGLVAVVAVGVVKAAEWLVASAQGVCC